MITACGRSYTEAESPSWKIALEEKLSELLPIFTPGVAPQRIPGSFGVYRYVNWSFWDVGGAAHFVNAYTYYDAKGRERWIYHIINPKTNEPVTEEAAYIYIERNMWWPGIESTFITTGFYLHMLDDTDIPTLFIRWHWLEGISREGFTMHRYHNGIYVHVPVSSRWFWDENRYYTSFLHTRDVTFGAEMLAKDSEGRILTLGAGGSGGFGTWARILTIENEHAYLEPFFNIRFDLTKDGERLRLYTNETFIESSDLLTNIKPEEAFFFPTDWYAPFQGIVDFYPVAIPILPDVKVAPVPRLIELEQELTERITSRLIREGLILP